jgi:hypothetical protein
MAVHPGVFGGVGERDEEAVSGRAGEAKPEAVDYLFQQKRNKLVT